MTADHLQRGCDLPPSPQVRLIVEPTPLVPRCGPPHWSMYAWLQEERGGLGSGDCSNPIPSPKVSLRFLVDQITRMSFQNHVLSTVKCILSMQEAVDSIPMMTKKKR